MREFLHSAMATIKTIHALSRMRLTYGIILAILFLALATHSLQQILNGHGTQDFGYFYHAAQAMRQGQDIYAATKGHYIYPPFLAFVLQPLTLVPEQTAAIVWIIINASLMFGAALIAAQEGAARWHRSNASIDPSMPWAIAAVASILVADKIDTILILGQTEGIMLLGFACTLRWMDRRPLLAGAVVGLTASIKYVSLIFVPYFLFKRNFRAAVASVLAFIFFLLVPATQFGLARGRAYATAEGRALGRMIGITESPRTVKILKVTWDRSVSITSAVFRLTRAHGFSDGLALTVLCLIFVAIVVAIVFICRHHGVPIFESGKPSRQVVADPITSLEWAIMACFAMTFSPQTTMRHMVLFLLIYTVAASVFLVQTRKGSRTLLILAVGLAVASISLPQSGLAFWRLAAGPSWCAIILILTLVWTGGQAAFDLSKALSSTDQKNAS